MDCIPMWKGLLQLGECVGDALDALTEFLFACGVGEADVALGTEGGAGDCGHVTDGEEVHGEVA